MHHQGEDVLNEEVYKNSDGTDGFDIGNWADWCR